MNMMFRMKVYNLGRETLVAVCDSDIVGQKFKEEDLQIEIKENFYGEQEVEEDDVKKALKEATIANLSGKKVVKLAINHGVVEESNVLDIGGCWHAQMTIL